MASALVDRIKRINLEVEILKAISSSASGLSLGELQARFKGEPVTHTIEHLADRFQVERFPGYVFGITDKGRSRLTPKAPVCLEAAR